MTSSQYLLRYHCATISLCYWRHLSPKTYLKHHFHPRRRAHAVHTKKCNYGVIMGKIITTRYCHKHSACKDTLTCMLAHPYLQTSDHGGRPNLQPAPNLLSNIKSPEGRKPGCILGTYASPIHVLRTHDTHSFSAWSTW